MKKEKVIIRTYSAGVHYGTLVKEEKGDGGYYVILENSRRIWKWSGANSLSELATLGTSNPKECKFSLPVIKIKLHAIEIISITNEALNSIESVDIWSFSKDEHLKKEVLEKYEMG